MKNSRAWIARMFPLAEPVFENTAKTLQRPVKPEVYLSAEKGSYASVSDVSEAEDTGKMNRAVLRDGT